MDAVRRAEVLTSGFDVSSGECEAALRYRQFLATTGVDLDCVLVDVLDLL